MEAKHYQTLEKLRKKNGDDVTDHLEDLAATIRVRGTADLDQDDAAILDAAAAYIRFLEENW